LERGDIEGCEREFFDRVHAAKVRKWVESGAGRITDRGRLLAFAGAR
jgi:hypothetical protein